MLNQTKSITNIESNDMNMKERKFELKLSKKTLRKLQTKNDKFEFEMKQLRLNFNNLYIEFI